MSWNNSLQISVKSSTEPYKFLFSNFMENLSIQPTIRYDLFIMQWYHRFCFPPQEICKGNFLLLLKCFFDLFVNFCGSSFVIAGTFSLRFPELSNWDPILPLLQRLIFALQPSSHLKGSNTDNPIGAAKTHHKWLLPFLLHQILLLGIPLPHPYVGLLAFTIRLFKRESLLRRATCDNWHWQQIVTAQLLSTMEWVSLRQVLRPS